MRARQERSRTGAVAAVAAVSLLAGCGNPPDGEPVAESIPRLTFHPCDGIGPDARVAAGIDGKVPVRFEDREEPYQDWACSFRLDDPYSSVVVSSAGKLLSKSENDKRLTLVEDTQIGEHRTLVHDFPGGLQCVASVDFDNAVLEIMVMYKRVGVETADQACPLALKVAQDLSPWFPEHL
ncbi:DUF3558 domain-containing protein [Rhodococcus sp. NPDC049939]|uniref:DUF3558 domain-containing protein n=1 Tax=Rhodococcus sp. NPDC049939 TaxID=3155511 RepID=UPI0033E36FD9